MSHNVHTIRRGEIEEKVRVLQEKLQKVEAELDEGLEERSGKYAELRSKEKMITGEFLMLYIICMYIHRVL